MKILENISSGYKRIATGIAIVAFLSILYIALIPVGSVADVVNALSGTPIIGAVVKIAEYPQYNTTTAGDGTYLLDKVPYDNVTGSTYTLRFSAAGYGSNSSPVTLTELNHNPAVSMDLYPSDPRYIPLLDHRGTLYEASVQVFNPYDFNTTADITAYNGAVVTTTAFEVPINNMGSRFAKEIAGGVNFVGSLKVENTRPQTIVQGIQKTMATGIYTVAPSSKIPTETTQYIPYLDDRGSLYDAGIQIYNPNDVSISANLTGISTAGVVTTLNFTIPAKSFGSRYAGQVAGGSDSANVNFVGSIIVNTSLPAIVQASERTLDSKTSSFAKAIIKSTQTTQYVPYVDDRGTLYDAGIQVINPNDEDISANLTGITTAGVITTLNFTVPAKSFRSRYAGELAGGADGANVNFVGSVIVNTSQPAIVQGSLRTLTPKIISMAPAKLAPTATVQYIPFLNDTGTAYDSGIQIFNPNDVSITATLTGYNLLDGQTTTLSFDVPAMSFRSRYAGELAGGVDGANVDFVGSVKVVTSTQPALVQGTIRTKTYNNTMTIVPSVILE